MAGNRDQEVGWAERLGPANVFASVAALWLIWAGLSWLFGSLETRGQFGDSFGGLNALFSGLAFAGVIYAVLLQRRELQLQREELRLTREELRRGAEAQAQQAEMQRSAAMISAIAATVTHGAPPGRGDPDPELNWEAQKEMLVVELMAMIDDLRAARMATGENGGAS